MAGLNIPHRSELPHGTFLGDLNRARLDAQQKATDIGNEAVGVGADLMFGEDTGDDMLTDLAYGAVPGGSLYQRAKTGTRPGALDLMDIIPGGGAAVKAASMFVPSDVVKLLGRKLASPDFEKTFVKLPQAIQESWLASFGDLSSKKLKNMRSKAREHGTTGLGYDGVLQSRPSLRTYSLGDNADGYYYGYEHSINPKWRYTPQIVIDSDIKAQRKDDALLHEGFHLMDEAIGTSDVLRRSPNVEFPSGQIKPKRISEEWMDNLTKVGSKYPFNDWDDHMDFQDITGELSPILYRYDKSHPELLDYDSNPIDWLAADPHGKSYFLPLISTIPDERRVSTEGFAQFGNAIPYHNMGKSPALTSFVKVAEKDPRRNKDFDIKFDDLVEYLENRYNAD